MRPRVSTVRPSWYVSDLDLDNTGTSLAARVSLSDQKFLNSRWETRRCTRPLCVNTISLRTQRIVRREVTPLCDVLSRQADESFSSALFSFLLLSVRVRASGYVSPRRRGVHEDPTLLASCLPSCYAIPDSGSRRSPPTLRDDIPSSARNTYVLSYQALAPMPCFQTCTPSSPAHSTDPDGSNGGRVA